MIKILKFTIVLIAIILTSCQTALQVAQCPINTLSYTQDKNIEFIGFKNLNRNNVLAKDYGAELERTGIAVNKQNYYMGVFSLQELEIYKSSKRYVAFVDVTKHQFSNNDAIEDNAMMHLAGWITAACSGFALFPIYVPLICCSDRNKCLMTLKGSYVLYVYDTETKAIALSIPMEIDVQEKYIGQFFHKSTDKIAVQERYRNMLYNLWTEYFMKASRFLTENN